MIEKIKEHYGQTAQVLSVQEYYNEQWNKYGSDLPIEDQISECVTNDATIISFHITVEKLNEETGKNETVDVYPDVQV